MRVEVLLATHNGQKYVGELLESLAHQNGVEIDLIVSDDKSTDKTLQIVNSYANSFRSLIILNGPNTGAKNNFAHLIQYSDSDFSAFADQDDIWFPNHLSESVNRLAADTGPPAMAFSKVIEFSEFATSREWPQISSNPSLSNLLTENLARGCTIVLNRKLMNLLKQSNFDEIYMHDWWAVLVAKTCGKVEFINATAVKYRIHEENIVGTKKPTYDRARLFLQNYFLHQEWLPQRQASQLFRQFGDFMTKQDQHLIQTFANLTDNSLKERYKFLNQESHVLRQSFPENVMLKLLLLLAPKVRSK
jgi:glycosyltransferase involved in cell wall biosynthesis